MPPRADAVTGRDEDRQPIPLDGLRLTALKSICKGHKSGSIDRKYRAGGRV